MGYYTNGNVGRSLYTALNRTNSVENGRVSLVVPMAMALAKVPIPATILRMKSSTETPLFTISLVGEDFEISPASIPAFIFPSPGSPRKVCTLAYRFWGIELRVFRQMTCIYTNYNTESNLEFFSRNQPITFKVDDSLSRMTIVVPRNNIGLTKAI